MQDNQPLEIKEYTQAHWIIWAFSQRPNSTTGEIYDFLRDSGHMVRNITGRMSDARNLGAVFLKDVDKRNRPRYRIANPIVAEIILERWK